MIPIPTARLLALLLLGAALFAGASLSPLLLTLAVALTAAVVGVAALDLARSPRPAAIVVTRAVEDRLSLGAENEVTLSFQNRSRYDLRLLVRDEAPEDFRLLQPIGPTTTMVGQTTDIGTPSSAPPLEGEGERAAVRGHNLPSPLEGESAALDRRVPAGTAGPVSNGMMAPQSQETSPREAGVRGACIAGGTVDLPALGQATLRYAALPVRRGAYRFGDVTVRYPTGLGLLLRQHTYPLAREVKVYPNLRDVKRYELALRRGHLQEVGLRRTRQYGVGAEFERLRDYHPDDDYRRINWLATARRHRPVTIDYQIERAQNVLLLLDVGRLMSAPIGALTKLDHAVNACLLTAYVCLARGDNVGLLAFADRVTLYLHPRGGKGQFHAMLESLYNVAPQATESDYRVAFAHAEQRLRRRALVVVFTEIVDADASRTLVAMLARAATRHVAVCATMRDPIIDEMATLAPSGSREVYRRAVALTLDARRRATLDTLHARGVIPIDVPANRLTPEVISTYLDLKARGRL